MKNKKVVLVVVITTVFALILFSSIIYYMKYRNIYKLSLPDIIQIKDISIEFDNNKISYDEKSTVDDILNILNIENNKTRKESLNDSPSNFDEIVRVRFELTEGNVVIYVYKQESKYFIEQPYNGIYEVNKTLYENIKNYIHSKDISIDNFYDYRVTDRYDNIDYLGEDYSLEDAKNDNCFVVSLAKVYNEYLYEDFVNAYENKNYAFIRLVNSTSEGSPIIFDIKYDNELNKIIVISDNTRDNYASNRNINLREFEKIGKYIYKENLYWVAYNGYLEDNLELDTERALILTTIN